MLHGYVSFPVISTLTNKSGGSVQNSLFYVRFLKKKTKKRYIKKVGKETVRE